MNRTEEFKIFSESDLEKEFDIIGNQLIDTSKFNIESDWNNRIKALKRMQALVSSDYIGFENFPALFLKFTGALSIQLNDLRSAVVKEASSTIILAASVLGEAFELCAERLTDALYRLINSGNKLLADTGSECFIEVIKAIVTWRLVPKTLEQFSSKNPNIRTKACTFLQLMLELYPCEVFEYAAANKSGFLEKLEQGLKLAVHDASSDTRAVARKAFLNYRTLFPTRATKLFQNFDGSIQRAFGELTESRNNVTPARSTSANSSRVQSSTVKIESNSIEKKNREPKSMEKKTRNSLNEIRDLSSTGGTTPDSSKTLHGTIPAKDSRPVFERPSRIIKEEPTIENIIAATSDLNWSIRVSAFEALKGKVVEENSVKVVNVNKNLWDQLMVSHLEHLVETNSKVSSTALNSLFVIIDTYPEKVSLALEKMLPKLLICLSDNKDSVVESATKVMELIIDIYIPEDLLALLLKYTAQELKATTHIKFVEILAILASSSTEFFLMIGNIRAYVSKILMLTKETPKGFGRNLMQTLEISFEKNRNGTINVVKELPSAELAIARVLMQENFSKYEPLFKEAKVEARKPAPVREEAKSPQIVAKREDFKVIQVTTEKEPKILSVQREEPKAMILPKEEILTAQSKPESLKRIQRQSEEQDDLTFEKNFVEAVGVCHSCLLEPSLGETAITTMQSILKRHLSLSQKHFSNYISSISKGFYSDSRHILQAVEECIEELISSLSPSQTIPVLLHHVKTQDVPAIQAFIRVLTKCITNSQTPNILPQINPIFNQMKESLNHGNADVRKSVVFCLVEIQSTLQSDFGQYLAELTPSQQKLVTIYIQRKLSS